MKKKQLYKPNFFFNTIKYFEELIFNSVSETSKAERLAYYIHLKDKCQKEIDAVLMKNNKTEIFKLLNYIDNNGSEKRNE